MNSHSPSITLDVASVSQGGHSWRFVDHNIVVIGRDQTARIPLLNDELASRFHCRIEMNPPLCYLTDLDSRYGTLVNGERVQEVALKDGDVIRIGETEMRVSILGGDEPLTQEFPPDAPTIIVEDLPSAEIPEYEIRDQIGCGQMGVVYEAVQRATGRTVALKLIHPETAVGNEAVQHFVREVSILTRLRHRRIVESIEFGLHEWQMYLVMEYIETIDLQAKLESASPANRVKLACGIVCQVLEGLQYAHEHDIVHRDVKPANILAYMTGHRISSKLADFGLAKNFTNAGFSDISPNRQVKGSFGYMAPEQILDCRFAKPPCDIYSAGACLYQFLSGHTPHDFPKDRNPFGVVLNGSPVPITDRIDELPADVVSAVEKALAWDPAVRFVSASEMRRVLLPFARSKVR